MTADAAEDRRQNARLIGTLLGIGGAILLAASLVALAGWLPFSVAGVRALTLILAVIGVADLIIAFAFVTRSRQ